LLLSGITHVVCFINAEYEDLVYEFASKPEKLNIWREHVQKQRTLSGLFDVIEYSKVFTRLMQATWEIAHLSRSFTQKYGKATKFHIFSSPSMRRPAKEIEVYNVGDTGGLATETGGAAHKMRNRDFVDRAKRRRAMERAAPTTNDESSSDVCSEGGKTFLPPIPDYVLSRDPLLLNIGGIKRISDWINVNSQSQSVLAITDDIDVVRKMHNLYGFENGSVSAIYSSHTLEHAGFGDQELQETLTEWRRVLKPGGLLFVSVPDLPTLSEMYLDQELSFSQHWMVTRMMYGAQMDDMDYHKIGFDETLLATFLTTAGFCDIQRVGSFNLPFADTSDLVYAGYFISLNIIAR
jgi:predicted SAM-dependent methyltransferase